MSTPTPASSKPELSKPLIVVFAALLCCGLPILPLYLWRKGRLSAGVGIGLAIAWVTLAVIGAVVGGGSKSGDDDKADAPTTSASPTPVKPAEPVEAPDEPQPSEPESSEPTPEPVEEPEPELTVSQENALEAGQNYVDMMPFSKHGLIEQLSSSAGSGFPKADAVWAANHVDADWKAEAVEAAEAYMEMTPMSRSGLIEQLTSTAGSGFTRAEAVYAADKLGL